MQVSKETAELLERKFIEYNKPDFIENDPIQIPHSYTLKQDIEIAGFFAAILAWGKRKTIISKCKELLSYMDGEPYNFICNAQLDKEKQLLQFKHRTFNSFDLLYTLHFLQQHYQKHSSLEGAFVLGDRTEEYTKQSLINFKSYFFTGETEKVRTSKHIPSPISGSACKRLNMYLRWMVRKDTQGVDFGLWKQIPTSELIIPCDVHVENVARKLNLTNRPKADWAMATEITQALKTLDSNDPAKYDFSLFGMGVEQYFG